MVAGRLVVSYETGLTLLALPVFAPVERATKLPDERGPAPAERAGDAWPFR